MNSVSEKAVIYKNVRLVNSDIGDYAVIADDCDLSDVVMASHAEFGRRNIIRSTSIGYGSYTGQNSTIKFAKIGNYCCISSDVNIYGGVSHNYRHLSMYTDYWYKRTFGEESLSSVQLQNTVVGSDVWIGSNVVILGGICIGDGAVIGAGAVVTKDVLPYSIVAGNPAREINKRFSEQIISELVKIKWWEFPPNVLASNVNVLNHNVDTDSLKVLWELKKEFEEARRE